MPAQLFQPKQNRVKLEMAVGSALSDWRVHLQPAEQKQFCPHTDAQKIWINFSPDR